MLYIMRHGKTDWNCEKKLQGCTDIPLNEEGRAMAEAAGQEYTDVHFDRCYVSPLLRARETAELVLAGRDVPILPDERLREMSFGVYEGTVQANWTEADPPYHFFHDPENYQPGSGGEAFEELFARTGEFLREVVLPQVAAGQDILIVGHGAMNSSIVCQVRGLGLAHFWDAGIPNCKLIKLI